MSDTHPRCPPPETLEETPAPFHPLVVRRQEAELLGTAPDTIALLADAPATGGLLGVSRTTLGRDRNGATPHYHRGSAEMFFVLDGGLRVLVGDDVVTAHAGDMLVVPPRTTHAFAAAPGSGADVLIVITPGVERSDYFRLLDRIRGGRARPQDLSAVQERFDTHFVDSTTWHQARDGGHAA